MKLAMYLRISKEDGLSDESNSISNQRVLIKEYILNHPDLRRYDYVEFKDDGLSGKRNDRPEFNRMLDMIRIHEIDCVIVKDMSRFSRDQLIAGKYREQIFPFLGVRFIAINDNYDSATCNGAFGEIDLAFKEILNDMYSEDISEKVKASLDIKRSNGKYICERPPYGYIKSPEDKHKLIPDETAADIIRGIYEDYLREKSMYVISKELNQNDIPSPARYMEEAGISVRDNDPYIKDSVWTVTAISRILRNEVYIGNMLYGKSCAKDTGQRQKKNLPQSEWNRIEGTHEPIVDKKTFKAVQEKLSKINKSKVGGLTKAMKDKKKAEIPLYGRVCCKGCGRRLCYTTKGRPKFCCVNRYSGKYHEDCITSIRCEDLEMVVRQELQKYLMEFKDFERVRKTRKESSDSEKKKLQKKQKDYDDKIVSIKLQIKESFEGYIQGRVTKDDYLEFKQKSEVVTGDFMKKKIRLEKQLDTLSQSEDTSIGSLRMTKDMLKVEKLDPEIVDILVDRIDVSKDKEIEIIWKFKQDLYVIK